MHVSLGETSGSRCPDELTMASVLLLLLPPSRPDGNRKVNLHTSLDVYIFQPDLDTFQSLMTVHMKSQ